MSKELETRDPNKNKHKFHLSQPMVFLLLFGIVSLFSDMTHEGAASIQGEYLKLLGASATVIGFVSGLGELLGYSLRYVFGKITDKTKKYWPMTIIGYIIDIIVVPLLAFVGEHGWIYACILLTIGRIGKAIKKPAKDTIMSFAASQEDVGKSFGIQEMLDQIGAFLGPLLLYLVMLFRTDGDTFKTYSICFMVLLIPAVITIGLLFFTKHKFPNPDKFEPEPKEYVPFKMKKSFIFYIIGISIFAFGFIDYSLVAMHIGNIYIDGGNTFINEQNLPLIYSAAMIVDAIAAIIFGKLYDKFGVISLVIATIFSGLFSLFIFEFNSIPMLFIGIVMWGIGMGAQESILKAAVTNMVPKNSRATGYGIFEMSFGIFWFLGSWLMGYLYDISITAMVITSSITELIAIPCYIISDRLNKKEQMKLLQKNQ